MKRGLDATFIAWRFYLLIAIILLIVAGLITRLIFLSVINKHFLQDQGNQRAVREIVTPAFRGMITDRNGYPLAVSTSVYSIWLNPKEFSITPDNLNNLSYILGMKKKDIKLLVKRYSDKDREFVYIKRDVSPEITEKVKTLAIPGVYEQQEYKRYYPEGEVAAHVIGFTNVDDQGQEGLELEYNDWLAGKPGKDIVIKDRLGRIISNVKNIQAQKPGSDLVLSINRRLQYMAYRELLEGIQEFQAESGSVVILDVKSGEVLAMVNFPSFNPNNRLNTTPDMLRNRAITDTFEPGSTIKAFSVASALASGLYHPDTIIDTTPGWIVVGRHTVQDEHTKGPMTVEQILDISSDVGVTKMILTLPPEKLAKTLQAVGFGAETGIGFPGERSGVVSKHEDPFALATLAFGYGITVTPLQLAHAYAIIANDGIKIPVSLLKLDKEPDGKRVMDSKTAKQMMSLLQSVVETKGATGKKAKIPGFHVAGKTGTSRLLGESGYEKHHHTATFVGIAPVTNPRLVVAVVIHDPRGQNYYGADVSAPIFKNVMESALRLLNIPPDDPEALEPHKTVMTSSAVSLKDQIKRDLEETDRPLA